MRRRGQADANGVAADADVKLGADVCNDKNRTLRPAPLLEAPPRRQAVALAGGKGVGDLMNAAGSAKDARETSVRAATAGVQAPPSAETALRHRYLMMATAWRSPPQRNLVAEPFLPERCKTSAERGALHKLARLIDDRQAQKRRRGLRARAPHRARQALPLYNCNGRAPCYHGTGIAPALYILRDGLQAASPPSISAIRAHTMQDFEPWCGHTFIKNCARDPNGCSTPSSRHL